MRMHLIPRDCIPPRRSVKGVSDEPEPRYRADGKRAKHHGYDALIREFLRGPDAVCEVSFGDWPPPVTVYQGLLSARGALGVDIARRGRRVYLARSVTDRWARAERREAARDALLLFDTGGERIGRVECSEAEQTTLYGLFQRQRTAAGLGHITVSRGADGHGIVLVNTMIARPENQ
jgi:hypothetical protein